MMRGTRNLLWLLPLLLLLGWPLYGGAVRGFLAPPELREVGAPGDDEQRQRFALEGVRLFQDQAGVRQWRIASPWLRTAEGEDLLLLGEVDAVLFSAGRPHLLITARQGRYDLAAEILWLEDDVRMREPDGFELTTPELRYDEKQGLVSSRAGVVIRTADLEVSGRHLDYDLATGHYVLSRTVRFLAH